MRALAWVWIGLATASVSRGAASTSRCATCHQEGKSQPGTRMAHALTRAVDCDILNADRKLSYHSGSYSYAIERGIYSVTDGKQSLIVPLQWAFGGGAAGQTYVFEKDGALYESRVSFYNGLNGLDLTMGAVTAAPVDLMQAAGRKMDEHDVRDCFGCHATGVSKTGRVALNAITPGVQCEHCHGPVEGHVSQLAPMPKLSALSTEEISNLCGGCHRTWELITMTGPKGVLNVRFQPYRLTNSKCYDAADRRIACTACHNPHKPIVRDTAFYDTKCRACHGAPDKPGRVKACPVAQRDCVSCHMPKVELPGAHFAFTDHMIRVAREGEVYPH